MFCVDSGNVKITTKYPKTTFYHEKMHNCDNRETDYKKVAEASYNTEMCVREVDETRNSSTEWWHTNGMVRVAKVQGLYVQEPPKSCAKIEAAGERREEKYCKF